MGTEITLREGHALYGLLTEASDDVIIKLDRDGFVLHASPAIERLGMLLPNLLIGPNIAELSSSSYRENIRRAHEAIIARDGEARRVEFPASGEDGRAHWFELHLRALTAEDGEVYGALGVLRSIQDRKALEQQLLASERTDSLTGLPNRRAFLERLADLLERNEPGHLAIFDIDHLRRINMARGQAQGDRVLVLLSDFLRNLVRKSDVLARIGGESFAILLPHSGAGAAETICRRILASLGEIGGPEMGGDLAITASAGLARIEGSVDASMQRAEVALFLAKAQGRNRLEIDRAMRSAPHH